MLPLARRAELIREHFDMYMYYVYEWRLLSKGGGGQPASKGANAPSPPPPSQMKPCS